MILRVGDRLYRFHLVGDVYEVEALEPDAPVRFLDPRSGSCTCPDSKYRGSPCKHARALWMALCEGEK